VANRIVSDETTITRSEKKDLEAGALIDIPRNELKKQYQLETPAIGATAPTSGAAGKIDRFWGITARGSNVRTEVMAGLTTFFASAFTILTLPGMIAQGEVQLANAVFIAAALAAAVGTFLKAFYAKLPFVQAPGMGLGSFFAFTVMPALAVLAGNPDMPRVEMYQLGLSVVVISGVIFTLLAFGGLREKIVNGIPRNIKLALGSGIGLFITLLGLRQSGLVVPSAGTFVTLVNFGNFAANPTLVHGALLSLFGFLVIAVLAARKVKGGMLIGIIATAVLAYATGHSHLPENFSFNLVEQWRDFTSISFFRMNFGGLFAGPGSTGAVAAALTGMILVFLLVNMLDALGTIFGIANSAGLVDEKGEVIGLEKGLTADAVGTVTGGLFGASTVTTVVSSASGISEGGRTGLTSATTGVLWIAALFFAPFVSLLPLVATAPALIFVGCLMMSQIGKVDFSDLTEAVPAFLTIAMMPLTFSIANGIAFGLISYIVLKLATGRWREISPVAVIIAALFVLQYII